MNKPIKAKNLPLFSIIDLDQLRREKHLEGTEVTDFFTARDGKVYLLMEQPSETQGKDWLSTPSTYTAVEIQLDWAEQRVLETTLFPLGLLKFQFHYLRPAGDNFLLLGGRCAYRGEGRAPAASSHPTSPIANPLRSIRTCGLKSVRTTLPSNAKRRSPMPAEGSFHAELFEQFG